MRKPRATAPALDTATPDHGDGLTPLATEEAAGPVLPVATPVEDALPASVSPFGEVPRAATWWGIQRVALGGAWDVLAWGAPTDPVESREWPLADLSVDAVRERWGAGTYRVQWLSGSERGGRKHINYGRTVTLRAPAPASVVASPAAAPVSPFGPEMDRMMQLQRLISGEATDKMTQVLQFAAAMTARPSGGLGAAELQLILQKQAETSAAQTKELVTALLAPISAKLDALEGDEEDDEDGEGVANAARIAGGLIKGKGWLPMVLNWANGNPEVAKEVVKHGLPIVASAATKIAEVIGGPAQAKPMPVAVPYVAPSVISPTNNGPSIEQGSISSWPSSPAAGAPPAA